MAHIVVIGGGPNALSMAHEMFDLARASDRVTVVADGAEFKCGASSFRGSVANGARNETFALASVLERKGIGFSAAGARRLHPEANRLELGDGTHLDYDFLVIATGPRPAFEDIEGLGPAGYTQSLCRGEDLPGCARAWEELIAEPGPVVVGAVQGATCIAPAYEAALRLDAELRHRRLRDRVPFTFVTAEPWIGHLGLEGLGDSRSMLESALRERGIGWITGARVERVEAGRMHVIAPDASRRDRKRALPFRYAMMMPPFRAIDALAGIDGVVDERGSVIVDAFQRNPKYRNIYAACVAVTNAAPRSMGGASRVPCMVESSVATVAQNIRSELGGRAPSCGATWNAVTLADLGAGGLAFVAQEEPPKRSADGFAGSDWLHISRCSTCNVGN